MGYKETLYFVAKCLTISIDDRNKKAIEKRLQLNNIDWDSVVKVSTSHYVFSALYCNLKRSNFLHYLPKELVTYMEYITNLNRERNEEIIKQARDLNGLLLRNNIKPIFLKGTANLLAGIYKDTAERMVGDIDFIFSKEEYPKAIKLLRNYNYFEVGKYKYQFPGSKHYRRIKKNNSIAAIEIHSEIVLREKYRKEFNYSFVEKDLQIIDEIRVLSYANKLNLSIISDQINDEGIYFNRIILRNAYDIFLLSKKTIAKDAVNTLDKLRNPLNCFLAACYVVFNNTNSLEYNKNSVTAAYLKMFNYQFSNPKTTKNRHRILKIYLFMRWILNILYKSVIYKEYQVWLLKRITDKNWYREKLMQIGFKNKDIH